MTIVGHNILSLDSNLVNNLKILKSNLISLKLSFLSHTCILSSKYFYKTFQEDFVTKYNRDNLFFNSQGISLFQILNTGSRCDVILFPYSLFPATFQNYLFVKKCIQHLFFDIWGKLGISNLVTKWPQTTFLINFCSQSRFYI